MEWKNKNTFFFLNDDKTNVYLSLHPNLTFQRIVRYLCHQQIPCIL